MSLPARELSGPRPARRVEPGPAPEAVPRPTRPAARRRRQHRLGFFILSSALVGSMVLGIVTLNVLLAQTSFRVEEVERRIDALSQEHVELVREEAKLSAPGRIAVWARRHGMRLPDDIRVLHVPDGPADPAGVADSSRGRPAPEDGE